MKISRRNFTRMVGLALATPTHSMLWQATARAEPATTLAAISAGANIAKSIGGLLSGSGGAGFSELHVKLDQILRNQELIAQSLSSIAAAIVDLQAAIGQIPNDVVNANFVDRAKEYHKVIRNELDDHREATEYRVRREVRDALLVQGKGIIAGLENRLELFRPGFDAELTDWASTANGLYNSILMFSTIEWLTPDGSQERLQDLKADLARLARLCRQLTADDGLLSRRITSLNSDRRNAVSAALSAGNSTSAKDLQAATLDWLSGDEIGELTIHVQSGHGSSYPQNCERGNTRPVGTQINRFWKPIKPQMIAPIRAELKMGNGMICEGTTIGTDGECYSCPRFPLFDELKLKKDTFDDIEHGAGNARLLGLNFTNAKSLRGSENIPTVRVLWVQNMKLDTVISALDETNKIRSQYRTLTLARELALATARFSNELHDEI